MEEVILVNEQDIVLGSMEKMEAHVRGALHRAFSVFILNDQGQLLLQQRALEKYHSGGLWTNSCCSHPRLNETLVAAGERRLQEELGFTCPLQEAFHFIYKVNLDHDLIEHELDHVLIGHFSGNFNPNPNEVMAIKWIDLETLAASIKAQPENYTSWLQIIINEHYEALLTSINHENNSRRKF